MTVLKNLLSYEYIISTLKNTSNLRFKIKIKTLKLKKKKNPINRN